jgi:trehalose-phosphatase
MSDPPAAGGGTRDRDAAASIPLTRLRGRPLLLMFDVDGTLSPIAEHPSLARVPAETRRLVASIVTKPGVIVGLVSGRAAHDARRLVGVENVWTVGNHGAEVMAPGGEISVDPDVARYATAVASAARALEPLLAPLRGVILENKGWTLSVHYRMADEAVLPRLLGAINGVVARNGLRLTEGKKVLEIRPPVPVDKGTAVYRLARDLGALEDGASVLFAGDDATDEDAFRRLRAQHPEAVTIRVGRHADSAAEFVVADPDAVRELLQRIARTLDAGT